MPARNEVAQIDSDLFAFFTYTVSEELGVIITLLILISQLTWVDYFARQSSTA